MDVESPLIAVKAIRARPCSSERGTMAETPDIDIIGCEEAGTIPGLFYLRAEREPDGTAFSEFREGRWAGFTWREMLHRAIPRPDSSR